MALNRNQKTDQNKTDNLKTNPSVYKNLVNDTLNYTKQ